MGIHRVPLYFSFRPSKVLQRAAESYPTFSTLVPYCLLYHALIRHRYSIFDLKVIISNNFLQLLIIQCVHLKFSYC